MRTLLLALSLAYPVPPHCSEGTAWVDSLSDPPAMLLQAKCDGCTAVCKNVGTRSEGWYSSCDGALIAWTLCGVREPVACTMEAKLCPDGVTYVGRQGPDCAFAACPGEEVPGTTCAPYVCADGTKVDRCTPEGTVIHYFAEPCLTHGGEEGAPFEDVTSDHENADAIYYVKEQGIVEGYQDGTYKPASAINRAEFVKILMGAFPGDDRMCKIAAFRDVDQSAWYASYAHAARCKGVVSGYADGTFRPANTINFVEAAKILSLSFGIGMPGMAESDEWFAPYVRDLERHNAIPTSITSFNQNITRGEMAEMIYRLKTGNNDKPSQTYEGLSGALFESSVFKGLSFKVPAGFEAKEGSDNIAVAQVPYTASEIGNDNAFLHVIDYSQYNTRQGREDDYRRFLKNARESYIRVNGEDVLIMEGDDYGRFEGDSAGRVTVVFFPQWFVEIIERPANTTPHFDAISVGKQILASFRFTKQIYIW